MTFTYTDTEMNAFEVDYTYEPEERETSSLPGSAEIISYMEVFDMEGNRVDLNALTKEEFARIEQACMEDYKQPIEY